ncbi:MAG: hypothetical protein ACXADO_11455 [Candidatus Thorarchaeota archaeon]|jgi:hypothetical protein
MGRSRRRTWVRHGGSEQKPLKKGELIRRKVGKRYRYGRARSGFGMQSDTVGGKIFVEHAKGQRGSISGAEAWHRDHDHIERVSSRKKKPKKK